MIALLLFGLLLLDQAQAETSPFYYNTEDLTSIQSVGLAASALSALAGHPNTVALTLRPMTLLSMCKPPSSEPQYALQVPIVLDVGSDPATQYYASLAVYTLPLFIGLLALAALLALVISVTTELKFSECLSKGRFPGSAAAPYMYLGYQSLLGSATLFSTSSADSKYVVGAIICLCGWALLLVPLGYLIFVMVPRHAIFVLNFAETSQKNRHKRKRLLDHVREYMIKLDAEDRALLSQHSVIPEYDTRSEAPTTVLSLFSSVMTRLKMWGSHRGIPEELLAELGPEAEHRLKLRRNATYSHMLALKLEDLDKRHSELTEILHGPHRWEDVLPDPDQMDIPLQVVSGDSADLASSSSFDHLRLIARATGFVQWNGVLFESYKRPWFAFVEVGMCIICGIAQGYRPPDDQAMSCTASAAMMAISTCLYSLAVILMSVHVSWFEDGIVKAISLMQAIAAIVAFISLVAPGETMELASYLLALLSLYIVILKGLLHTYELLVWWLGTPGIMWPAVDEFMMHYKEMNRDNSTSKQAVKKILVAKRLKSEDAASNHSSASATRDGGKHGEYILEERQVYVNEEDEAHFASVGGRSNAFVSSRGVPVSLLPFNLAPLPKYTALPARTRTLEEGLRAYKKQSREGVKKVEKKRLWEQVKHLFSDVLANNYETMDLNELRKLADEQRRRQEASTPDKKGINADNLLGEVRERIEQEHRRNEEIDDLRKAVLKSQIGEDTSRVQEEMDKGNFYNGGPSSLKGALFDTGTASEAIQNRSMFMNSSLNSTGRGPSRQHLTESMAITNASVFDHAILASLRNKLGSKSMRGGAPISNASLIGRSAMGMSVTSSSNSSPASPLQVPMLQRPQMEDMERTGSEQNTYRPPAHRDVQLRLERVSVAGNALVQLATLRNNKAGRGQERNLPPTAVPPQVSNQTATPFMASPTDYDDL